MTDIRPEIRQKIKYFVIASVWETILKITVFIYISLDVHKNYDWIRIELIGQLADKD